MRSLLSVSSEVQNPGSTFSKKLHNERLKLEALYVEQWRRENAREIEVTTLVVCKSISC